MSILKVYNPLTNDCKTVISNISVSEIDGILNATPEKSLAPKTTAYHSNIRCHHGKLDKTNRSCICADQWSSSKHLNFPKITTMPIYMCSINRNIMTNNKTPQSMVVLFGFEDIVSFLLSTIHSTR